MTPEQVHYRQAENVYRHRSKVPVEAFAQHPNRFKGKVPVPESPPVAAWINKPAAEELESDLLQSGSHFH